jgi:hypothetical protein
MKNTRFGILLEETKPAKLEKKEKEHFKDKDKDKSKKREKDRMKECDSIRPRDRYKERNDYGSKYKNKKEDNASVFPTKYIFDETFFPELTNQVLNNEKSIPIAMPIETKYLDATMTENAIQEINNLEEEKREQGWVYYIREKNTNRFFIEDHSTKTSILKENTKYKNYAAYKKICDKYIQWKNKYISTWGYDQYEKMYLFPNYDYMYFDKLDDYEMNEYYKNDDDNYYESDNELFNKYDYY